MITPFEEKFNNVLNHKKLPKQTSLSQFCRDFPEFKPLVDHKINEYFRTPNQKISFLKIKGNYHLIELFSLLPNEKLPSVINNVMIEKSILWSADLTMIESPTIQSVILPIKVGYNQVMLRFDVLYAKYRPTNIVNYSSLEESYDKLYPHNYFSQEIIKKNEKYFDYYNKSEGHYQASQKYFIDELNKIA